MGKRIIVQRRGRGTPTYRVKTNSFKYKIRYPRKMLGEGQVVKIFTTPAHSAPLAKINTSLFGAFYIPAFKNMFEGQKIYLAGEKIENGTIAKLGNLPVKTKVYCIESRFGDGGKYIKSGGTSGEITKVVGEEIFVLMPSKQEKKFNKECRAVIGIIAGAGRLEKPILKAGKNHYIKKSKNKLWPRTSAIKMNAIDHPFGSGRGKVPKSKIAKRNAPAGAKVGLLRPRRTGKRK